MIRVPPSGLYNQVDPLGFLGFCIVSLSMMFCYVHFIEKWEEKVDPVLEPFIGAQFLRIVKGIINILLFIIWVLLVIWNESFFDR